MKIIANITYESVLSEITDTEQRNQVFNNLDRQSQRMEIAWDALQLITSGKVKACDGDYWSDSLLNIKGNSKELQNVLVNKLPECEVCARGLMMLSQIRLGNDIDSNDTFRYDGGRTNMKGFSYSSYIKMEMEYEHSNFTTFYKSRSEEKLANICCNILVNGNFNSKDKFNYLTI